MRRTLYFILVGMLALTGCSTIQQWIGPDCECEEVGECPAPTTEEITHILVGHHVGDAHQRAASEVAPQDEAIAESHDRSTSTGSKDRSGGAKSEPVDPLLDGATVRLEDDRERTEFANTYGVRVPQGARAYRSNFGSADASAVFVHRPGQSLVLYEEGAPVASVELEQYADLPVDDDALPLTSGALDLINGDRTQLKLIHTAVDDDGVQTHYVAIYKLIGEEIGTIFRMPIATKRQGEEEVRPLGDLQFVAGDEHHGIVWTEFDEAGDPTGDPVRFEWNHWEGVYRIPRPPPTAPDRQS